MPRRAFLGQMAGTAATIAALTDPQLLAAAAEQDTAPGPALDGALRQSWMAHWERNIIGNARNRYCDGQAGEELGWLVSPFLSGFYYGYQATGDVRWVKHFLDWTGACLRRAVIEPDGFPGWPKGDDGGSSKEFNADSLLGEAMLLRPVALMAHTIRQTPVLEAKWGSQAQSCVEFCEKIFQKWDSRECWREAGEGGLWVAPAWGIDLKTGKWSAGYSARKTGGFSDANNKQNYIALWMLALFDVTQKPIYRERAAKWFQLMKSRMKTSGEGKYFVWNYWEPAGPWDYKPDGSPKHWVGVHPNGGYYDADVRGIVSAFEHGLVFTRDDIGRLIATNRDFMWNQLVTGAKFQRIDGGEPDARWKDSPGVLWTALVPYDAMLRKIFLANHNPSSWGGLEITPWFLAHERI
jgi:hypothetical protein